MVDFDLEWAANMNLSQRKNDFLVVDNDPDADAPAVPRDILLRDPDSDGVSFRATLNDQLVLTNGVSRVTINVRGDTTKAEVIGVSGGPSIITPQPRSTGLLTGGEIVAGGVPASEYTVETGNGVGWDGTTDPTTPTLVAVTWPEFADQTTIGVETFVYITFAGALNLSASRTPALDRSHILLGVVLDSGTSLTIINAPITANQIGSYLSDLYAEIAVMINDVVITPNANLTVQNSAGTAFGQSINWHTDRTTPNEIAISANNPMPMTYVTQDGDFAASTVTNMDVANYNPTGNTISAIGGGVNNSTNQRIYITPFGFATLYGQNIFSSLDVAVNGADTENPTTPEWLLNYGTLLVTVSVTRAATDLSDDTQAKFNYSAAGGSAGDNHDHSRLDSPDGLIVPVLQADNNGDLTAYADILAGDTERGIIQSTDVLDVTLLDSGNASGFTTHIRDNAAGNPPGWTSTVAPSIASNTDGRYSYWTMSSDTTVDWDIRNDNGSIDVELTTADIWNHWQFGPMEFRDGQFTDNVNYFLGVYRDNAGAIDLGRYSRVQLQWDSATPQWRVRGQARDGSSTTSGAWNTVSFPIFMPFFLRVVLRNNANKTARSYIGTSHQAETHTLLLDQDLSPGVVDWNVVWLKFHSTRGAGVIDTLYTGAIDYQARADLG